MLIYPDISSVDSLFSCRQLLSWERTKENINISKKLDRHNHIEAISILAIDIITKLFHRHLYISSIFKCSW